MAEKGEGKRDITTRVVDNTTPNIQDDATLQISATELQVIRDSVSDKKDGPQKGRDEAKHAAGNSNAPADSVDDSTKAISRSSITAMLKEGPPGAERASSTPGKAVLERGVGRKQDDSEVAEPSEPSKIAEPSEPATSPSTVERSGASESDEAQVAVEDDIDVGFTSEELAELSDAVLDELFLGEHSDPVKPSTDDSSASELQTNDVAEDDEVSEWVEPLDEPIDEPIDEPTGEPIDKPVGAPVEEQVEEPVNEPVDRPEQTEDLNGIEGPGLVEEPGLADADRRPSTPARTPEEHLTPSGDESSEPSPPPGRVKAVVESVSQDTSGAGSRGTKPAMAALAAIAGLGTLVAGVSRFAVYDWLPMFHPLVASLLVFFGIVLLIGAMNLGRKAE